MSIKKALRTAQTFFPWGVDLKAALQAAWRDARHKPHEEDFRALPKLGLAPDRPLVDVGANRGQSIRSMKLCLPHCQVVAFEAHPMLAAALARRYAGDTSVAIEPFGLGNEVGEEQLFTPSYNGYVFDGLASFQREAAADWLNPDRLYLFDPRKLHLIEQTARIRTLDSVGLKPALIKIDVQGLETEVVLGGLETIKRHRPVLLIETGQEDTRYEEILLGVGYRLAAYEHSDIEVGHRGRRNTFFLP
jgi:FkbM family methyltransferase